MMIGECETKSEEMMSKKMLVIYGSWMGSTKEIAQKIGESLREEGAQVDVLTGREVQEVQTYDGVIIGSAIRMAGLNGKMCRPVRRFAKQLKEKPVAGFLGCSVLSSKDEADPVATAKGYMTKFTDPLGLQLMDVKPFMGTVLLENARGLMKISAKALAETPELQGDQRDWEAISGWAKEIYAKM